MLLHHYYRENTWCWGEKLRAGTWSSAYANSEAVRFLITIDLECTAPYGPTEATVGCCTFKVDSAEVSAWEPATVPIGRPIANDQVYILGQRTEPVPVGVAGELCIGGRALAPGRLSPPHPTGACFVPTAI